MAVHKNSAICHVGIISVSLNKSSSDPHSSSLCNVVVDLDGLQQQQEPCNLLAINDYYYLILGLEGNCSSACKLIFPNPATVCPLFTLCRGVNYADSVRWLFPTISGYIGFHWGPAWTRFFRHKPTNFSPIGLKLGTLMGGPKPHTLNFFREWEIFVTQKNAFFCEKIKKFISQKRGQIFSRNFQQL